MGSWIVPGDCNYIGIHLIYIHLKIQIYNHNKFINAFM